MRWIKNIIATGFLFLLHHGLKAQSDTIAQRIVLIGDAGQLTDGRHPVVDAVRKNIPLDSKTLVLFLGDNLYKNGLPDSMSPSYYRDRAVLDSQLSVADGTPAKVYMIPGNHDWQNGSRGGYDAIVRQQLYVTFKYIKDNRVSYFPEDGCPGPVVKELNNDVVLVMFDSQWWIHAYDKPEIESDCQCKTKDELVTQIKDIASKYSKKLIVIACHHPFKSNGPHGGFFRLKQHIFPFTDIKSSLYLPLPLIGSAYPISRSVFGTPQDLKHPNYTNMVDKISEAVKSVAPNVIFVAGHEHNLELIKEGGYNYVISGGGCKTNRASEGKNSEFISPSIGFSVMEISKNKNVTIDFYTVVDSMKKVHSSSLLNFSPARITDTITAEIMAAANLPDSVTRPASKVFHQTHGLRKFLMGQNYRTEWSTPVRMKTFDIDREKGGFIVTAVGGGTQTKSLKLKQPRDTTGKEWVLRRVEKNSLRLPDPFGNYLTAGMARDLTSATHPYGALIVPGLAAPLKIVVPKPQLFFVEDDARLRGYRNDFAGKACLLEDAFTTYNGGKTKSTSKVFTEMMEDNDHRPDQPSVLTARLLDMLMGDFDRHFDQWRWYKDDTGKGEVYYPIARDRDQAFFYSDGKVMKLFSGRMIPLLKGFRKDIPNEEWLSYTAKDFDRVFLNDLDAGEWKNSIKDFQQKISDSIIRAAVKNMPPEIAAINSETIIQKLQGRRNVMLQKAMSYYNFISKKVNIIGSNQKEYFKVSNYGEGLQVRVYERGRGNDTSFIMYDRIFNPSVTKEIRLYGLSDDDVFEIEENAVSRIKLRIIGGNGVDTFNIRGRIENLLYDRKSDSNIIKNSSHSKNRFTVDPPTSSRNLLGFEYNTRRFPMFIAGYNSDDGYLFGAGYSKRTHGFRNLPYASDQKLSFLYSSHSAYRFHYRGEFNHITRNADILIQARFASPALRNFYGLGNRTTMSADRGSDFYRIRYKELELEALFRHRYFEKLHVAFGPYYYHYESKFSDNSNNILTKPRQIGLDSADVFSRKMYFGGKATVSFDNRNNELFPTRGILWHNELVAVAGLNEASDKYSRITTDMTIYASQRDPAKVVAVIRFGGGHIFGKNYEYFQALDLGANNHLHGFRKNRYAGKSSAYASLELRAKLFDFNTGILPGQVGLMGFYDAGRVALKDIRDRKWHGAYGAGVYFIPFNLFFISASAGFSGKEKLYNISIGSKINLTF